MFSIQQYLSSRKQRVKISNAFTSWKEIFYGIPQGSILRPLIFNDFLCDLFFPTWGNSNQLR